MSSRRKRLREDWRQRVLAAGILVAVAVLTVLAVRSENPASRGGSAAAVGNRRFARAAAACAPESPSASPGPVSPSLLLGISASIRLDPGVDKCEEARLAAETGVQAVREDIGWAQTEPHENQYDWSNYDAVVRAATEAGLMVLPILDDAPTWASPGKGCLPSDAAAYASFTAATVARYGPGGAFWRENPELPERPLLWYELWNEPWNASCNRDPGLYARLVVAAVTAGRATSSDVRFLIDGDTYYETLDGTRADWIAGMYAAVPGLGRYFDALSIHPYGGNPAVQGPGGNADAEPARLVEQAHAELAAHDGGDKPLWVTEIGWSTCSGAAGCVTEGQQAQYLEQFLHDAMTIWRPYVRAVFVYDLRDIAPAQADNQQAWFGLLRPDLSRKPAWSVLRHAADSIAR